MMFIRKKNFFGAIYEAKASIFRECLALIISRINYYSPSRFPCGQKKDFVLKELGLIKEELIKLGEKHGY